MIQVRPSQNIALKRRPFVEGWAPSLIRFHWALGLFKIIDGDDYGPGIQEEFSGKLRRVPATAKPAPIL